MRIAMIGAGYIAGLNGRGLLSLDDVTLCAISNRTLDKAKLLCEQLGLCCPVYEDYHTMLEIEKPDAVVINLAHHLHLECFVACAKAGVDIMIEKALGNTYEECLCMIEAAKRYKVKATVCHTQRYNAVYQATLGFLHEHDLGPLLSIDDHLHCHYFWDGRSPWQLSQEQSGGGIALNYGVHQLDRVHLFLGQKTKEFHACYLAQKPGIEVYSSYAMMGVGDKGTPYSITCTGYSGPSINETRLVFERGILQCSLAENGVHPYGLYFGNNETGKFVSIPVPLSNDQMYNRQFRAAVDYLSGKADTPPIPLEWAAEMVRLVKYGYKHGI